MLGYILFFIICAIIALCTSNSKQKSVDKFVKSKTKYIRTQELPEEAGVESALPPIPAQTETDALSQSHAQERKTKSKSRSPRVRFSKRVVVRTFEKSTRDIIGDDIADMKPNDT
jgi:hypothetical protein